MEVKKVSITDFSTGIIPSQRSDELGAASVIKNFDIFQDPHKLIPVTAWESFATTEEKNFAIQTLSGRNQGNTTILGLGRACTNWYSREWGWRVGLTALSTGDSVAYLLIDLGILGTDFWDNVKSNGGDVRLTDTNHDPIPFRLINFDVGTTTGYLLAVTTTQNVYVYWGNSAASGTNTSYDELWGSAIPSDDMWPLNGDVVDYEGIYPLDNSGTYVSGGGVLLGQGHGGSTLWGDDASAGDLDNGANATVSFLYKGTSKAGGSLVWDDYSMFEVTLTTAGKIQIVLKNHTATRTGTASTTDVCNGSVHHVLATYVSGIARVYINGVLEAENDYTADSKNLNGSSLARVFVNARNNAIEFVEYGDQATSSTAAIAMGKMGGNNAGFWTVGTYEEYADITPTYGGVQVYQKDISGGDWIPFVMNGYEIRSASHYPIHGMLIYDGTYLHFVVSLVGENSFASTTYLARGYSNGQTTVNWTVSSGVAYSEALPRSAYPVDKKYYFNGANVSRITSATYTATAFATYATPECLTPYDQYLAVGSDLGGKSVVQLWDMDSNLARALIDVGVGNIRVVGNVFGTIFAVINNNLTSDDLGAGDQSVDIKVWTGGAEAQPWLTFKSPTSYDGAYTYDDWKQPVNNQVEYFRHGMVFWAKMYDIDNNEMSGLWAIGKNERNGKFALTMLRDTAGMGDIGNIYRVGNNLLVANNYDGSLNKTSATDYSADSVWQSAWLMGSGNDLEDQLVEVEVDFEPLEAGQTVTVEVRTNELDWIEIGTITTTGAVKRSITQVESDATDLPAFRELQIRVTSTGGKSAITGVHYIYEDLTDD